MHNTLRGVALESVYTCGCYKFTNFIHLLVVFVAGLVGLAGTVGIETGGVGLC